jgi:urease subunit gamma/beta
MHLTQGEMGRLMVHVASDLARSRQARGLALNIPEAIAIVSDAVIEAARDGLSVEEATIAGHDAARATSVLEGVSAAVDQVQIEAVFDDGVRLVVVRHPFGPSPEDSRLVLPAPPPPSTTSLLATNTGRVAIHVSSHAHFFEVNRRLAFRRAEAFGMRLAIETGETICFEPLTSTLVHLSPVEGDRIIRGGPLTNGSLDDPDCLRRSLERAATLGYDLGANDEDG